MKYNQWNEITCKILGLSDLTHLREIVEMLRLMNLCVAVGYSEVEVALMCREDNPKEIMRKEIKKKVNGKEVKRGGKVIDFVAYKEKRML